MYQLGMSTKFVRVVQSLYKNTQSHVWNGDRFSGGFRTVTGVKQGCVLSPLLFALYINDLEDSLETGIEVDGLQLKLLMYADDIVILADDPAKLQIMIRNLEEYCQLWNLVVNLEKSKIIIFQRGGGVRKRNENWTFAARDIEVVKEYAYLGIILTPRLSLEKNFKTRLESAKLSIGITWRNLFRGNKIRHNDKLKLFDAVARSILCYGSQVWGFQEHDTVEKLQRFFIKKMFYLPEYTPNYMITLETALPCTYIYTLKCHFEYLLRVLYKYQNERLPHLVAWKIINKNIYWFDVWQELAEKHNIDFDIHRETYISLRAVFREVVRKEEIWLRDRAIEKARMTVRHELYDKLHYFTRQSYLRDDFTSSKVSLIWRYRGGLIKLNASPWRKEGGSLCSLCNLDEDENLLHFIGRCPILAEFRVQVFGKRTLSESEVVNCLNGRNDFDDLYFYVSKAWKYRTLLVEEFNC